MHYIDSEFKTPDETDTPSCIINYPSDCNDFCVVSAIQNYTNRLVRNPDTESLLFLIHFIGDVHQPLHIIGKLKGGNGYPITFEKKRGNMHGLWDSLLINKRIRDNFNGNTQTYLDSLLGKIKSGVWMNEKDGWVKCRDLDTVVCPLEWSRETGVLNCKTVWRGLGVDLGDDYYFVNSMIAEKQIAIAGVRMAAVLNEIFGEGDFDLKKF